MIKTALFCWLALVFSTIGYLFWHNEWQYSLPTPVPPKYSAVDPGTFINLHNTGTSNKPVLLHFFNPACPCSRFNIPEFKKLVKQYDGKIAFKVVVLSQNAEYTVEDIQDKIGLTIPVLFDQDLASSCGVYSTPQAVLLDGDSRLYYRGNYNKSRYCTDKKTNYAQIAIDSLLRNSLRPAFTAAALTSYGCTLPACNKPGNTNLK